MIRKSTNEIFIKPKMSSTWRWAIILAGSALLLVVIYLSYLQGINSGNSQYAEDRALIAQLSQSVEDLRSDLASSEENLIVAQRHRQIQEEAYKQISSAYASAEQKNRYLGSRLDFYRSIISPQDGQSGPVIQALETSVEDDGISFNVTLVQAIKHKHQVRGNLRVELYHGQIKAASWPVNNARNINFQYFQQIPGVFENVEIKSDTRVKVTMQVQDAELLERWFDIEAEVEQSALGDSE